MGRDAVRMSIQGTDKREWKLRQESLSPSYTSKWDGLLEIDVDRL